MLDPRAVRYPYRLEWHTGMLPDRFAPYALSLIAGLAALFGACESKIFGQASPIITTQFRDVTPVLLDIHGRSAVFTELANPTSAYYTPFFAFKSDGQGRLIVKIQPTASPLVSQLSIWLLISPQVKVNAIANFLRNDGSAATVFHSIAPSQLTGLPLARLSVKQQTDDASPGPIVTFRPVVLQNQSAQAELMLSAYVSATDAASISDSLRDGIVIPEFEIDYSVNAVLADAQSAIQADLITLSDSNAAKSLANAPRLGDQFAFAYSGGALQVRQPFMTRAQSSSFSAKLKSEMRVVATIHNESDTLFLESSLDTFVDKLFVSAAIDTDATPLGQQLRNMSVFGLAGKSFDPDKVDQLVADIKNFFVNEAQEVFTTDVDTDGDVYWWLVDVSADGTQTRDEFKRRLVEKGWKFEAKGMVSVPKALEVDVIDSAVLRNSGSFSILQERSKIAMGRRIHRLNTGDRCYDAGTVDNLGELAVLKGAVGQLQNSTLHLHSESVQLYTGPGFAGRRGHVGTTEQRFTFIDYERLGAVDPSFKRRIPLYATIEWGDQKAKVSQLLPMHVPGVRSDLRRAHIDVRAVPDAGDMVFSGTIHVIYINGE